MKKSLLAILIVSVSLFTLAPFGIQAQQRKTGAVFDPAAYAQVPYKSTLTRGLYTYPAKASVKQFAPYAGDQGQYGICTGWASAYSALAISYAKLNRTTVRSRITHAAFSPSFAFRSSFSEGIVGCDSGPATTYVLQSIQANGVSFFSDLDSLCLSAIPAAAFDKA